MTPAQRQEQLLYFGDEVLSILEADSGHDGLNRIEDIVAAAIRRGLATEAEGEQYTPFIQKTA